MKRLALLLSLLLVVPIVSATDTDGDGFDDDVDHRDDEDAHIILSLTNWNANTSEEWDNDNGAPDPHFQVCIDADGERVDCFDSPKWTDTFQLGQVWNLTVNIPDDSSLLEFTIECRDDDIANDDECDMNNQSGEWKLVFIFAWLDNPSANYSGSGFGDDEVESRNAASNWTVFSPSTVEEVEEIQENPDTDGDGYNDDVDAFINEPTQWSDQDGDGYGDNPNGVNPDLCRDSPSEPVDSNGCTQSQITDSDGDGVLDISDQCSNTAANISVDTNGCPSSQSDTENDVESTGNPYYKWTAAAAIISIFFTVLSFILKRRFDRSSKSENGIDSSVVSEMHSDIRHIKKEVDYTEKVVEEISERL